MKRLTIEDCEQIGISTIVRKQKEVMLRLRPALDMKEFYCVLADRLECMTLFSVRKTSPLELRFTSSAPHFGGIRYWLLCPHCGKRVGKLYRPNMDDKFECRHCHNLTYTSSQKHNHRVSTLSKKLDIIHSEQGNIALNQTISGIMQTNRGAKLLNKVRLKKAGSFPPFRWLREQTEQRTYDRYVRPLL